MKTQRKPRLALLAALLCAAVTLSACSSAEPTEAEQSAPEGTTSIESTVSEESTEAPSSKEESSAPAEESSEASSSEAGSSEEAASSRPEPVEDDGSQHQRSFTAMDTAVSFTTFGGGEISLDEAEAELSRLEAMFSVTNKDGDVGRLNAADGKSTDISKETQELLTRSLELNKQTNGTFDITLYPILKKWGFTTGKYSVPSDSELKELLALTGSGKLTVSQGRAALEKGSMIDLGGIAKGYAGDRICKNMKERGVTNGLVLIGGAVWAIGTKPDGSYWKVGIADPNDPSQYVGVLSVSDAAVATSGGYERYFEQDGKTYCHILDPKTGKPADPAETGIVSATVVGSDGTLCDALSTALFVMGTEEATKYLTEHSDIGAVLITTDNSFIVSGSLAECFKTSGSLKGAPVTYI